MSNSRINIDGVASLKKGREFSSEQGHPWIFSGALDGKPKASGAAIVDGSVVLVSAERGHTIGLGFYNSKTSIAVRVFAFGSALGFKGGKIGHPRKIYLDEISS